jgi:hypothetical protein
MNFQMMNNQRKLILIAAAIGVISVFLPWVTVSMMGFSESVNGFRGVGIIVFLAFAGAIVVSLMGDQTAKLEKTLWLLALASGAIAFIFALIAFADTSGGDLGFVGAGHGFGIWLSLIAALAVTASAWFFKSPSDNIASSFESLKTSTFAGGPAKTNKVSELEKLIEMKNQGKISEEEYQQLKSKII